jgi:hypothetical protein
MNEPTRVNGSGTPVQVNPVEVARLALQFLERVARTKAEDHAFDMVWALLNGIATGQFMLAQSRTDAPAPPIEPPPAEH